MSDGSLLFLLHLLSKMRDYVLNDKDRSGGRIGIILNGSPLFTGGAGSGESEIRRYVLEHDLLEAIVALPTDMFYNKPDEPSSSRGRPTNKKAEKRVFGCKIFRSHEFGYRRITIERPLRLSVQFTEERLAAPRFDCGALSAPMQKLFENFGGEWTAKTYGDLSEVEVEARSLLKGDFPDLKEKQLKDVLNRKLWLAQKELLEKAQALGKVIGKKQHDDFNAFEAVLEQALKKAKVALDVKEKKQLLDAVSWTNPDAEPVIKRVLKGKPNPLYGDFEYQGQVVNFQPDSNLRDSEDVPLTANTARGKGVDAENEAYFNREVAPHVKDAWIDASKIDERDQCGGIVGYEIPFNRHFYQYEPPRDLAEIDADLDALSKEIMDMLREVHS